MLPKSRLATLWNSDGAAPWSLSTTSWCLSKIQVTVVWEDSGRKESPGQGVNATGGEVGLVAPLP